MFALPLRAAIRCKQIRLLREVPRTPYPVCFGGVCEELPPTIQSQIIPVTTGATGVGHIAVESARRRKMTAQSACAVIVTYHPSAAMIENMSKVLQQAQALVVVDNGSSADELHPLRLARQTLGFHLIENGDNLGIAEALNQGIRWARGMGYPWVILFDQDSKITDGFIDQMFASWAAHPERERIGSLHPTYFDPQTRAELVNPRAPDGSLVTSWTSGALMPSWVFDRLGWFAAEYFIDFVDWEYCFRIRAAGYLIAESKEATLLHAPGEPTKGKILWRTVHLSNHDAVRRYYISRNCIPFYTKYLFTLPKFSIKGAYGQFKETIVCLLAEKDRTHKLRNILLGTWDGVRGRLGPRSHL